MISAVGTRHWPVSYQGFAGPAWHLDERLLASIVSTYYGEYFRLFLERYTSALADCSSGLTDLIERATASLAVFDTAWHYSIAKIREAVVNHVSASDALDAAVSCGAHLLASGLTGEFHASSTRGFSATWQNCFIGPTVGGIHVRRNGDTATVSSYDNGTHNECREEPDASTIAGQLTLPTIQSQNISLILMTPEVAGHIGCPPPIQLSPTDISIASENLRAAAHLLETHAPTFSRWVGRVLTFISPVYGPPGLMQSGSSRQWPAVAQISYRCDPVAIAEMLVHEATHQYFNILMMIERVTDGSDGHLYYSPVRNCERPIEMILLAYHAFANVLLYYRDCRRTGLSDNGFCQHNERELLPTLLELEHALEATKSLTYAGESLWRPLQSHLGKLA